MTKRPDAATRRAMEANRQRTYARAKKRHGMEYLDEQPESLPDDGRVLVHNVAYQGQRSGQGDFRFWLAAPDPEHQQPCTCAFAPAIVQHYRTRRPGTDTK
jgi:hypothetical protein